MLYIKGNISVSRYTRLCGLRIKTSKHTLRDSIFSSHYCVFLSWWSLNCVLRFGKSVVAFWLVVNFNKCFNHKDQRSINSYRY